MVLAAALAGCATPDAADVDLSASVANGTRPIVIAVIDSGTNPYLSIFDAEGAELSPWVPVPFDEVAITSEGSMRHRMLRDAAILDALAPSALYHFHGTRLWGISFDRALEDYPQNIDSSRHGIGTTYLAAREAPHAIIVSVQVSLQFCLEDPSCNLDPSVADAMEWVSAQDWIDVVSVSIGITANAPDPKVIHPEAERYARATAAAAASGKIVATAAGNEAAPSITSYLVGPPWIIAVGGLERNASGESPFSGKLVDVTANMSDIVPLDHSGEFGWRTGTSIATPIVAGTLAKALHEIRQELPDYSPRDGRLRAALNASAAPVAATDWDPTLPGRAPLPEDLVFASLPVVAPMQVGWGYVDSSLASEIARRVLDEDRKMPSEKSAHSAFQERWQAGREAYWNAQIAV